MIIPTTLQVVNNPFKWLTTLEGVKRYLVFTSVSLGKGGNKIFFT
jgi:hypothetical protein